MIQFQRHIKEMKEIQQYFLKKFLILTSGITVGLQETSGKLRDYWLL